MNPPREYFERGEELDAGSQRIGFNWYRFTDPDALARMISDGVIGDAPPTSNERIKELEEQVERLERKISAAINELE